MYSSVFVCLFGMGTVFLGLIILIILCGVVSSVCRRFEKTQVVPDSAAKTTELQEPQEVKAAAMAAIAEELGVQIERIRIISMKKI